MAMKTAIKEGEKIKIKTETGKTIEFRVELKSPGPRPTFYVVIEAPREIEIKREGYERRV